MRVNKRTKQTKATNNSDIAWVPEQYNGKLRLSSCNYSCLPKSIAHHPFCKFSTMVRKEWKTINYKLCFSLYSWSLNFLTPRPRRNNHLYAKTEWCLHNSQRRSLHSPGSCLPWLRSGDNRPQRLGNQECFQARKPLVSCSSQQLWEECRVECRRCC